MKGNANYYTDLSQHHLYIIVKLWNAALNGDIVASYLSEHIAMQQRMQ